MRHFRSVLVANRGEVVSRIARTTAGMGIRTVAVYTDSDADAAYLADVSQSVALGSDHGHSPYLDPEAILRAAKLAGVEAIHPGYGFLAEDSSFAQACIDAGLVWIGPPPAAMTAMAGKIGAKEVARAAGVPVLDSFEVSEDLVSNARLSEQLSYPLLVKPSAGGGGKGMHRVDDPRDLALAVESARREAVSSFGDPTLFVERYLPAPRHVEVQVFADRHGTVVHLGDRDCSIQRRHQKIVEEAPAPQLDPTLRQEMTKAATALTAQIGYIGAGTVEFLVYDRGFAFLEMNTRLQVEHPVTEMVTGLDLVELQLRIAAGEALPFTQDDVTIFGHAIEVRLYAEDPARDFLPSPGTIHKLVLPAQPEARWELGVADGSEVSSKYDPMIAKIVVRADTRMEAAARLRTVVEDLRVHGVATNRSLLGAILGADDFVAARISTAFLDDHQALVHPPEDPATVEFHAVGAALQLAGLDVGSRKLQRFTPYSWRNVLSQQQITRLLHAGREIEVHFDLARDGRWDVRAGELRTRAQVHSNRGTCLDLEIDGLRQQLEVSTYDQEIVVDGPGGHTAFRLTTTLEREDVALSRGSYVAELPGTVVQVPVADGDEVQIGDTLLVLEAMKMEYRIEAEEDGVVEALGVAVGQSVGHQQVLVRVAPSVSSAAAERDAEDA